MSATEHICDCGRSMLRHTAADCDADMEGPWECQSWPMHCCADCGCGSFFEAHPDDPRNPVSLP